MRTLIVTNLFPLQSERLENGTTTAVKELIEIANAHGLNADTVVRLKPIINKKGIYLPQKNDIGGIEVYDIPMIGFRKWYSVILTRIILFFFGFHGNFDIAVCHMCFNAKKALTLFPHRFYKLVCVLHNSDILLPSTSKIIDKVDVIIARSKAIAVRFKEQCGKEVDGVVWSGVKDSDFCNFEKKQLSELTLRVVIASVFEKGKNISESIEALAKICEYVPVSIDLFGSGPMQDDITKTIKRFSMEKYVQLHGFRPRKDVLHYMFHSDLFLMPSAPETFGLVYLEAMSQGCVVIGHKGWGIDGIIKDGFNGFLVDEANSIEIKNKIIEYLHSDRKRLHTISYETALKYTAEEAGKNYFNLIFRSKPSIPHT